ncbi:MAG TPA: hypothetical protein VKI62_10140 [Bacteroidota bacterium]|nr:hypothetical protein [Bacteroidota bacterium]
MSRRIEWQWFHPSATTGCRDIRQNVEWRSIANVKMANFERFAEYLGIQWS